MCAHATEGSISSKMQMTQEKIRHEIVLGFETLMEILSDLRQ